eukprot:365428-Chlamydomonas_euryale.AAC.23
MPPIVAPHASTLHTPVWNRRCPGLSITAVGARRALVIGLPGIEEDVGLIGIHLPNGGPFVELVPWTGNVEWSIDPWGRWYAMCARSRCLALCMIHLPNMRTCCPSLHGAAGCTPACVLSVFLVYFPTALGMYIAK